MRFTLHLDDDPGRGPGRGGWILLAIVVVVILGQIALAILARV